MRMRPEKKSLSMYVLMEMYTTKAMMGLGVLAITWAGLAFLAGGVSNSLRPKDLWCIKVIAMIQSFRIFSNLAYKLAFDLQKLAWPILQRQQMGIWKAIDIAFGIRPLLKVLFKVLKSTDVPVCWAVLCVPLIVIYLIAVVWFNGPIVCTALSAWRMLHRREFGGGARQFPALGLYIFYGLLLCQGVLHTLWSFIQLAQEAVIIQIYKDCNFEAEWGRTSVRKYLYDTRERCQKDPHSINGRKLIDYAIDLLDSGLWEDNLSAVRMLDAFIRHGADVRKLLLPSRPKVQKLIDTLAWTRRPPQDGNAGEVRKLAARILAYVAGDIYLTQFPGAIQCITSLLQEETSRAYWNSKQQEPEKQAMIGRRENEEQCKGAAMVTPSKASRWHSSNRDQAKEGSQPHGFWASWVAWAELRRRNVRLNEKQKKQADVSSGGCNELILQGLTILERLASDHHNCRDICSTPALLTKITAPVYSANLIEHIKISESAQVVKGSLKVLLQLIRAAGDASTSLRRDISQNTQAMSNLKTILETRANHRGSNEASSQGSFDLSRGVGEGSSTRSSPESNGNGPELQIPAMEILTQLALDTSVKVARKTKKILIHAACCIFIADGQAPGDTLNPLRHTAVRTLVLLSTNSEANYRSIKRSYDGILSRLPDSKNTVAHLSEVLDAKNNTAYRKVAAEILENLCTRSLHDDLSIQTLLPKVLTELHEMPSTKRELHESENSDQGKTRSTIKRGKHDGNQMNSAGRNDEESLEENSAGGNNTENQELSNEELTAMKELQEALLSLILAIYVKLNIPDDFNHAVENKGLEAFVQKLKEIVEENCEATADSLIIVKLCGQIAKSMMEHNPYKEVFRNKEFVKSLTKASKIMSSLESCMLFAETDFGPNESVGPLLSDIEREVRQLVEPNV